MMVSQSDLFNASILIVDDQPANLCLLEQLLSETGYQNVTSTTRSTEVCALHQARCFELILLDLKMPGMDGFQVMEALQRDEGNRYLPVIALTAEPGHKQRALLAGARDFISKPFDLVEVKTRIHNMLELRLLYKQLEAQNHVLEQKVSDRTAELVASEARFRGLTELASDWYWEQNEIGNFTTVCGPVFEMLGLGVAGFFGAQGAASDGGAATGWNDAERTVLQSKIAARLPFQDFSFSRVNTDGSQRQFRVSGEPMFDPACRYTGYRGIGQEIMARGCHTP